MKLFWISIGVIFTIIVFDTYQTVIENDKKRDWCQSQGHGAIYNHGYVFCVDKDRRLIFPEVK